MRILFVLIFSALFATSYSQSLSELDNQHMSTIIELCQFDEGQQAKLMEIYLKKQSEIARINEVLASNPVAKRSKIRAIYKGTEGSITLLVQKNQKEGFETYLRKVRTERAEKFKQLKNQGADQKTLEDALLGIY